MGSRHFHRKRVSGHFPECGAIFMADNSTRKECFERRIFGLPSNFASFVMKVKTGMLLFLFDYEDRKLYGLFEAISDGAMNIVPHAFRSAKKQFPAQVCFTIIWRCVPVPEEIFRNAIGENYFAPYKFNFGLSRDQVKRLLVLFEMKRIETQFPKNLNWKRKWQTRCSEANSEVGSKPASEDNSESLPEKPACLAISANENASDIDGYKPLPSTATKEIENPLPDGLAGEDFIPLPSMDLEEIEDPFPDGRVEVPSKLFASQQEHDALQLAIDSLFSEIGGAPLKEEPIPESNDPREGDKQIDGGCSYRVNGLYSDSPKERTSVFLRISGLSRAVKKERSHIRDRMDRSRETPGRLEKNQEMWKKVSTQYHEPEASRNRTSVFSRLGYNVGQTPRREPSERMLANENKCMTIPEEFPQKKRKNHSRRNPYEAEGIVVMEKEKSETNKRMCTSKDFEETRISDSSSAGLVLPPGSSPSIVSCGSCDAACKSDDQNSEAPIEELKFDDLTAPDKSCPKKVQQNQCQRGFSHAHLSPLGWRSLLRDPP